MDFFESLKHDRDAHVSLDEAHKYVTMDAVEKANRYFGNNGDPYCSLDKAGRFWIEGISDACTWDPEVGDWLDEHELRAMYGGPRLEGHDGLLKIAAGDDQDAVEARLVLTDALEELGHDKEASRMREESRRPGLPSLPLGFAIGGMLGYW